MSEIVFPKDRWERVDPLDAGFAPDQLVLAGRWINERAGDRPFRAVVVRDGRIAAEWNGAALPKERFRLASAAKSYYGCLLGIAVAEGVIGSVDDRVAEVYPEMLDVPDGRGPKPGRFAGEKDRDITFAQLISNTSGYLKPGEWPGKVFHYQTFGMNVLCHALATRYGYYDSDAPDRLPGFGALIEEKIRNPVGGAWGWEYTNFDLPDAAKIDVFGNYTQLLSTAHDMARVGWLWCNGGRWGDAQVVPAGWLARATRVADEVKAAGDEMVWTYGYGFWTNEFGRLWPGLPKDSFAAVGAGSQLIWVCPSRAIVIVESPGVFTKVPEENRGFVRRVFDALR